MKGQKPSKEARKGAMAAAANAARALTSKERKKIFLNRFSNKWVSSERSNFEKVGVFGFQLIF